MKNLYQIPEDADRSKECFETILTGSGGLLVERIISHGQTTPKDSWYDQPRDEWVMVLEGSARLAFDDGREAALSRGDQLFIPKQARHRVVSASSPCLWLAIHGEALKSG